MLGQNAGSAIEAQLQTHQWATLIVVGDVVNEVILSYDAGIYTIMNTYDGHKIQARNLNDALASLLLYAGEWSEK